MMKKILTLAMTLCLAASLVACSSKEATNTEPASNAITVTDQAGRTVTLDKPAEKVISGYYISTSTIIGLGQEDKLVGVEMKADKRDIYKLAAPEVLDLPGMGNKKSFNVEAAAETKADLVILPVSLKDYVDKIEALGMKVLLINPETEDDYDEAVNMIAKVLGAEEQAKEYFAYRDELFDTYIKDIENEKNVYFAGTEILRGAGSDMYQDDLLEEAEAENVMDETGAGWSTIDKESLLRMNPDVIFLEQDGVTTDSVYQDASLANINAVKDQQVYVFPSSLETWDTPNLSSCLGTLWAYATLYPDQLSMDTVKQEAKDFYQKFYDIQVEDQDLGL